MIIRVTLQSANADKAGVMIDVQFLALDGPYQGQHLDREFFYPHPTTIIDDIVPHLTDYANMLKVSLDAPDMLEGMVFEV